MGNLSKLEIVDKLGIIVNGKLKPNLNRTFVSKSIQNYSISTLAIQNDFSTCWMHYDYGHPFSMRIEWEDM